MNIQITKTQKIVDGMGEYDIVFLGEDDVIQGVYNASKSDLILLRDRLNVEFPVE